MWTYNQANGVLSRNGAVVGVGYSGHGAAKNDPNAQAESDMGPIPRGRWSIEFPPFDTKTHGPMVLRLSPCDGTETFGRSGFLIHGDSLQEPGAASLGCIVMPRDVRQGIAASADGDLEVA